MSEKGLGIGVNFKEGITFSDLEEEQSIFEKDQKRIERKYNSKRSPNFKLTAEYLRLKYVSGFLELDKKDICKELKISMNTLNLYLSELNRFLKFQPMRWIARGGEKDIIEVAGKDFSNSNKWIKKNFKGLISRTTRVLQTKEKVRIIEGEKELEKYRKKKKEKRKIKN